MSRINWPELMQSGLHRLQLRPQEFWALTPAELALMLGDVPRTRPLTRSRLEELARAFPDHTTERGETNG